MFNLRPCNQHENERGVEDDDEEEVMIMKEELELMTMRKETKHSSRNGKNVPKPNVRQAAAIALQEVTTVTCKLCDWPGCKSDAGFAKHIKSQHSNEQNYLFITPPEYEEATVKEGAAVACRLIAA